MAFDEQTLSKTHDITRISCQSNTQISSKVTKIISTLSPQPKGKEDSSKTSQPALVILVAQSRWANKLISIVEIAKRDLGSKGLKFFQYNALSSEIVEVERKPKATGVGAAPQDGEASEDEAFQTMNAGVSDEGGVKKRAVPVMTTYLALQPVKALRTEFG
jgi:hypothetical protein